MATLNNRAGGVVSDAKGIPQPNLRPALTVGQVIAVLSQFPPDTPVFVGTASGGFPAVSVTPMWDSGAPEDQRYPDDVWISQELPEGAWVTMEMRPWPPEAP